MSTPAQRRLQKVGYHSERLFALIRENDGRTEMCYRFAPTVRELYDVVLSEQLLGVSHTVESLQRQGWVARLMHVEEVPNRGR